MTEELKRTISLKLRPTKEQVLFLNDMFNIWGAAVTRTFSYINRIYNDYEQINKKGKCFECNTEDSLLKYKHKFGTEICNKCFMYKWSMPTLTKASGYQAELIDNFPELAIHKGYYAGVIKFSVQAFKSYLMKRKEREKEIRLLELSIESCDNILRQQKLIKKLNNKKKGLKDFKFRNNMIYFGNAGMFDFKFDKGFKLGISNPHKLRDRIWFSLRLGKPEQYKTDHNKFKIINDAIKTKEHKTYFGKILRRPRKKGYIYEFMLPKRDVSHSLTQNKSIEKYYNENPETNIFVIIFGVKQPIKLIALSNGKIKEIKNFGDGSLYHWINYQRAYRAKVSRVFAKRYPNKRQRNIKRKKFFMKRGRREMEYIKRQTHDLTTELITYIAREYKYGIIICRDTKGIKRINYPPIYRVVLDRWNIEMQKTMLEYKQMLKHFHVYKVPYCESNNIKCSQCGKDFIVDKKQLKMLTIKLNHAMDRKGYLLHREKLLREKIIKLLKYPKTKELLDWLKLTSIELSKVKIKLKEYPSKDRKMFMEYHELNGKLREEKEKESYKILKCSCGKKQEFYLNDGLQLYNKFIESCSQGESQEGAT